MPADDTPQVVPLKILSYPPSSTPPVGTILSNTTGTVPEGYLLCNGLEVSRTTYQDLFEVIGTYYGEGDNSTTFNVPNLSLNDGPHQEVNPNVSYIIKI
jgi:microcystin-dependent protein